MERGVKDTGLSSIACSTKKNASDLGMNKLTRNDLMELKDLLGNLELYSEIGKQLLLKLLFPFMSQCAAC